MAHRDRLNEILEIKERSGRHRRRTFKWDLERLGQMRADERGDQELLDELIPARIVTLLEVFVRTWIEELVDKGAPYVERAASLKAEIKYDFAIARSLHGGVVTVGQLIAHSISLNRLEAIFAVFETLLGVNFLDELGRVRRRSITETPIGPIIEELPVLRRSLGRLFELRHILVHELPAKRPFESAEIGEFVEAAQKFVEAADEIINTILYGEYPLTQAEMNTASGADFLAADEELSNLCKEIARMSTSDTIFAVQEHWQEFRRMEADRQTEKFGRGTIRPTIRNVISQDLTRARIAELKRWLENEQDE